MTVTYTWEWLDPNGTATTLWVEYDVKGAFAPPVAVLDEDVPGQPGARFREARHLVREFPLPLYWYANTASELHATLRAAAYAMDPTRGEGTLRATSPVGDQRQIGCRVTAGMDLTQALGEQAGPLRQRAVVTFRCQDPYWTAVSDVVSVYEMGTLPLFFPFFPLRLSASEIAVNTTVTNNGEVDSWPVWTITGPGSAVTLTNLTTGKSLAIPDVTLGNGESIVIDTRPGAKTVTLGDGTNLWSLIPWGSALWPLLPGPNAVRLEMTGTTADSELQLAYRPRYLTL